MVKYPEGLNYWMYKTFLWLILVCLLISGCSGAGQANYNSVCNSSGRKGTCNLTITELSGVFHRQEISNENFWSSATGVQVVVTTTVEKGRVQVWIEDQRHQKISAIVEPGQTVEIQGKAWLNTINDQRTFYVFFEALGEGEAKKAENIKAEVRYDMP